MTTETLQAHIRAYHDGTIRLKDQNDMVTELVLRAERELGAVAELKKRFDDMRDTFIEMIGE